MHRRQYFVRALFAATVVASAPAATAATHTVTSTGDQVDVAAGNGVCLTAAGTCTLRAALQEIAPLVGPHTIRFAIPTAGVATINIGSTLPTVSRTTLIDGFSQTTSASGNSNPVVLGAGGTVGTDGLSLPTVAGPEIEIRDNAAVATGLNVTASGVEIRGISIHGFGSTTANGDIVTTGAALTGISIHDNVIGSGPTAIALPATATHQTAGGGIVVNGPDTGTIANNIVAFAGQNAIRLFGASAGWTITGNELRDNGRTAGTTNGVAIEAAGTTGNTVRGNLIVGNGGAGVDVQIGPNTLVNNTIAGNGVFAPIVASTESPGVRVLGTGSVIDRNRIEANYGAGVLMVSAATQANRITRNAMQANGTIVNRLGVAATNQIGIDLLASTVTTAPGNTRGVAPFVTLNDAGDADAGANTLLNFPVITTALLSSTTLTVSGFARPGAVIELFAAAPDASGFGEGATYLTTVVEGSGADTDAATGTYTAPINGLNQGTDTTERFTFTIPRAALPAVGPATSLTATATSGGATSEFSGIAPVTVVPATADVAIAKTGAPNPARLGQTITYVLAVTNTGPDPAPDVVVTDTLPPGLTFVAAASSQGGCAAGVTCTLGTVNTGGTVLVTITATATAVGTPTNVATVASSAADPDATNNTAAITTTVTADAVTPGPAAGTPDLAVALDTSRAVVTPTAELTTFTAIVTNQGTGAAPDATVTLTISRGRVAALATTSACRTATAGTTTRLTCAAGNLGPGESSSVAVVVQARTARVVRARVDATTSAPQSGAGFDAADSARTAPLGRLRVSLAHPLRIRTRQLVPVAIVVRNPTALTARGITVLLAPPVGLPTRPATIKGLMATQPPIGRTQAFALGDIPPGGTRVVSTLMYSGTIVTPRRLAAAAIATGGVAGNQTTSRLRVVRGLPQVVVTG